MKTISQLGLRVPEILLPKNIDLKTWSVIACDQYTQDKNYWKNAKKIAGENPSTLNLILPEVYLNDDKAGRIAKIRQNMKSYLDDGIFSDPKKAFVYVERKTAFGRTRKGLVAQIDLETYEWKPFSKANIRATEATIVDRIPPRKEIRKGAPLELPHIMLLVNDKDGVLVEGAGKLAHNGRSPLYSGELMMNGGSITGWALGTENDISSIINALNQIAEENRAADGSTFLFAVGDGNHSLATAKAVWDEYKEELLANGATEAELAENPVRFALIEIVNIYDEGLTFEPIHRVIFNADAKSMIEKLATELGGKITELDSGAKLEEAVKNSHADFGFVYLDKNGSQKFTLLQTKITELAVARFQPVVDTFLKDEVATKNACEIDYIHGSEEVFRLGAQKNATAILLPPIAKNSFFETINDRGPLPRKSFSMGEADEKRFYLECRRLF